MFYNIGNKLGLNFLFGVGGIGDALLLMSDGKYDDNEELGLIFWANKPEQIRELIKLFPHIKKSIIASNYLNSLWRHQYYMQIVNDSGCISTGHIPKDLNYVDEWKNCNSVFDRYKIERFPEWANDFITDDNTGCIICPTGGSSDLEWKKRYIKPDLFWKIINHVNNNCDSITIISTEKEFENFYGKELKADVERDIKIVYSPTFKDAFNLIANAELVYSVDSWYKTLSRFCGVPTILIESVYIKSPMDVFKLDCDPSDNIFIKDWGFEEIIKQQ